MKTKNEALQANLPHQQAIVEAMTIKVNEPVDWVIPGGKTIMDTLDLDLLKRACYSWLRAVTEFQSVTISLAKDPSIFDLEETKILDFDTSGPVPIWMSHPDKKKYISDLMAETIMKNKLVTVSARRDGIYITKDRKNSFAPKRQATETEIKELGLEKDAKVPSEEWEPWLRFIAPKKLKMM